MYKKQFFQYEKMLNDLICMFNIQYQKNNQKNIDLFAALRVTLVKFILRFIALAFNYYNQFQDKIFD